MARKKKPRQELLTKYCVFKVTPSEHAAFKKLCAEHHVAAGSVLRIFLALVNKNKIDIGKIFTMVKG